MVGLRVLGKQDPLRDRYQIKGNLNVIKIFNKEWDYYQSKFEAKNRNWSTGNVTL